MKTLEYLLNNIRVGYSTRSSSVGLNLSKKNLDLINYFFRKSWIKSYMIQGNRITVYLRYLKNKPLFTQINLLSTLGHRQYIANKAIKYKISRYGSSTVILLTSKGLLTLKEAEFLGIGGELAFMLYY